MSKYDDTTDGIFTWNINLYQFEDTTRGFSVEVNEVALNFNTVDGVIQEIRDRTTNKLLHRLTIGDGITIVGDGLELMFNYSLVYSSLASGNYVHDVFIVQDEKREAYIRRSEFVINKSVGVANES